MADREGLPSRKSLSKQPYLTAPAGPELRHVAVVEQILGPEFVSPRPRKEKQLVALPPAQGESASWIIRTALCTEVRGGVLRVFMPPQRRYLEDYLELVAAIEDTAAELALPVLIEGYTPPHDSRIHTIKVTPDPGVIEVNTRPAGSWDDLVENTTAIYEEALASVPAGGTEKFIKLDGRHTGTGGGNHIVVGGPSPADSPLLRNPSLLKSLLSYWHNHPALSYVFSGLFVGPTSQAPRVDEARNDQVYELELALKQIPEGASTPPWIVDRILRNVLIDSTGNTHRTEFCVDKLYSPDSPTGRLGLLEMRAFEMPPHSRMSLTQHLLLESLIAMFWRKPYNESLVRWRTEVHDRFMLPHFVRQDMDDVVSDLTEAGYPFELKWLAPHFEFRFPVYGSIEHRGIELELRQAIEPWHVLGEESGGGGAVRYVDSSVERLQVLVGGMVDPRHVITCNGQRVLFFIRTGTNGQFVAGVRYRAWQPPSCLHPTIGVDAPLVFDILDTWSKRSIGGCTYHVAHPGGRSYDRFPVNAYEAESRRMSRFFKFGHTPGPMSLNEEKISKEFPRSRWTLRTAVNATRCRTSHAAGYRRFQIAVACAALRESTRFTPNLPDEMAAPNGSLRPHWQMFVSMLNELGPGELRHRWDHARRLIHENGVTHNVYGDPNGLDRPWSLDLIPLLISEAEWNRVSEGLVQRARLMDRLLADLYGPAQTVMERLLPPELLWANPGFLRPCHGIRPPQDRWLHFYAADLVRSEDGHFQVLSDRTQAPSGAGYSLENRIVLSRVLPTMFRQCNVQRLAPFFRSLRSSLSSLASANPTSPRIVLMTPGPYNETYFEHSFLARYLGYPLVQGNDLTRSRRKGLPENARRSGAASM